MQSIKETAANVAASAKSGMDKTKAVVQEKMERVTANNPTEKEMATEKKEEKINQAELHKQEAREQNATYSTTGETGEPTGDHQISAMPGHGTGHPMGQVTEGIIKSHPIGTATGTGRPTTAHNNTHVGADTNEGYGTGGAYNG